MALRKPFETPTGNSGDYWKVGLIIMERDTMSMEVRIYLYKSKADRDAGKRRMDEVRVLNLPIPVETMEELIAGIYASAKTTPTASQVKTGEPFFKGSFDV